MSAGTCKHAASGCDYPAGECAGSCSAVPTEGARDASAQQDERAAFEAWVAKEFPGFIVDRAPFWGFYKGDDGERIGDMWDAWKARAALAKVQAAKEGKS